MSFQVTATCKLCSGEGYELSEVIYYESDGSCDIGPVCLNCFDCLVQAYNRGKTHFETTVTANHRQRL